MDKGIILTHRNTFKQFFISKNTQTHLILALIKKAFHLQSDLKALKHPRGYQIPIQDTFNFQMGTVFEIVVQEDTSEDRSRSQTFSQKLLTKISGRKYPPHEKELLQSKLFIDDFQFFMNHVVPNEKDKLIGILFFNSKKKSAYLGKKILRDLIYDNDQIEFFYSLHPLKRHSTSILLGQTLIFSLFKDKKMIHQRQFPQNLSASEEINGYLKALSKNGQIVSTIQEKHSRNLIQVNEQRSVDDLYPKKQLDFDLEPIQPKIIKANTIQLVSPITKLDSPIKSQITNEINEISFENDFYEPEWFSEGPHLNRLNKSFLAALIKNNDQNLISFCHGLDLKNKAKEKLNVQLVKVFLRDFINKKLYQFSEEQRFLIELNQQNRHSYVFSLLLKLKKFGNIQDFIINISKHMSSLLKSKCSYVELARQIEKKKSNNVIRLKDCEDNEENLEQKKFITLIGKDQQLSSKNNKIADVFHKSSLNNQIALPVISNQYTEGQKAMITDLLIRKDPFLIECFVPSKWPKKKFNKLKPNIIRKYMNSMEHRYRTFRDFPFDQNSRSKYQKLQRFLSLLYYLYKQRTINKKQQKAFFYLYIWSDLNVLAVFELYTFDRNLQDLIETIFSIDYTYYLQGKYGLDMNEVENFTLQMEQQFIILFLINDFIQNTAQKTAIQKFIRAGDNKLIKILEDSKGQDELVNKIIENASQKKQQLDDIANEPADLERKAQQQKKQMKKFLQQIKPVHFSSFNKMDLVFQCIELNEIMILSIFQVYFQSYELMEWIDSFKMYIKGIDDIHMKTVLCHFAQTGNISMEKINECRTDLIQGVYDLYLITKDKQDSIETLTKMVNKNFK